MRKGFTLIELSIVLVIIGLLIGGILTVSCILEAADRVQMVVQMQDYNRAVSKFKNKYKFLPGDNNIFLAVGNRDGNILDEGNFVIGQGQESYEYTGEIGNFWRRLSSSGFIAANNNGYKTVAETSIIAGEHTPEIISEAGVFALTLQDNEEYFFLADTSEITNSITIPQFGENGVLDVLEYLEFDRKIDDGLANEGNIQGAYKDYASIEPAFGLGGLLGGDDDDDGLGGLIGDIDDIGDELVCTSLELSGLTEELFNLLCLEDDPEIVIEEDPEEEEEEIVEEEPEEEEEEIAEEGSSDDGVRPCDFTNGMDVEYKCSLLVKFN